MARQSSNRDLGILILRLGIGLMFMLDGFPKLMRGSDEWEVAGAAMNAFGIHFWPTFWGFMSALTEFGGGILLLAGLFTRVAAAFMFINMAVAASSHLIKPGAQLHDAAHAIEDGVVFLSLIFMGSGRYSLDAML